MTTIERGDDGFTCNIYQKILKNIVVMKKYFTGLHQNAAVNTNFDVLQLKLIPSSFLNVCATFGSYLQYDNVSSKEKFEEEVTLDCLKAYPIYLLDLSCILELQPIPL
jgi:hypothetical protein